MPAVAETKGHRRRVALLINGREVRLVVLFEEIDRSPVLPKIPHAPGIGIEVIDRNSGVVLHDDGTVREEKITRRCEGAKVHEVRRRLDQAASLPELIAKLDKAGLLMPLERSVEK